MKTVIQVSVLLSTILSTALAACPTPCSIPSLGNLGVTNLTQNAACQWVVPARREYSFCYPPELDGYGNNANCKWVFVGTNSSSKVRINIYYHDIQTSVLCAADRLTIDGTANQLGGIFAGFTTGFCGNVFPSQPFGGNSKCNGATASPITVGFTSNNDNINGRGFCLSVNLQPNPCRAQQG